VRYLDRLPSGLGAGASATAFDFEAALGAFFAGLRAVFLSLIYLI
jgi:hypothetical protein